jgi:hypothetical protein
MIPGIVASRGRVTEADQSATERRYLRIQMTNDQSNGGAGIYALSELQCYTDVGGADVLAGSGATLSATSNFSGGNPLSNLLDGNTATWWASASGGTQNIFIDWGANLGKNICEIGIKPRVDGNWGQAPSAGSVAYSADNVTYTTDWAWPFLPISAFTYPFLKMRRPALIPNTGSLHRFWGIRTNTPATSTPVEIGKLELRATLGGAQMATGGVGYAQAPFNSGFSPDVGFSGSGNQFAWAGAWSHGFLFYDFGEGNEKAQPAQLAVRASGIPSRCLTSFDLYYMDGLGQNPTFVENFTSPGTWTGSEVRLFNT